MVAVITFFAAAPRAWFFILLAGLIGWGIAGNVGSEPRNRERAKRKSALDSAQKEFALLVDRLQNEAGPQGFMAKREELLKLKNEYSALPQLERQELDKLNATARERQKQKFLDSFFIDRADIPGVGTARKSALRSFGIETAADVERHRVQNIRGFGQSLTRAVMDWRASCERKFTFNPSTAVTEADKNAVKAKLATRKTAIEGALAAGATELHRFKQQATARASSLQPQIDASAHRLAQARKDLALL